MKPTTYALVGALASWATANPVPGTLHYSVYDRDATITDAELSKLRFYAQYAAAAYCNYGSPVGATLACSENACPDVTAANATIVATFSGNLTDAQGFVSSDDTNKVIVVSTKGSESIRNWITDFVFLQVPCDLVLGCLLHAGFLTAWAEISEAVLAGVASARAAHPDYAVVFTGHSLGGAVSTVAAAHARVQGGYAVDTYTYGSPRVGNAAFVEFVAGQQGGNLRVTHLDDPVPRLPPIVTNYRHTSPEYWLSTGDAETVAYTVADVRVCEGFANLDCNGGTLGLDTEAHGAYFELISACGDDSVSWRRRRDVTVDLATSEPKNVSDEDLIAKLNDWVAQDRAFVATLDE
ncbi:alpha/beta-hydrolase [Xylariaceae sp. FL0662B]|nr:alpha/beta-hydrolase [Xylariaceae sp. FL0662B]